MRARGRRDASSRAGLRACCALLFAVSSFAAAAPSAPGDYDLHVAMHGNDAHPGTSWQRPLRTIQRAIELAEPGDAVIVAAGEYREDLRTVRSGRASAPIRLVGASGAVIRGAGRDRVVEIRHSFIELTNLDIDGAYVEDGQPAARDKLVYIMGQNARTGVTGVRLLHLRLANAGGECVRMKYFAQRNEVAFSSITGCGIDDFQGGGGAKNGEAIYIGTAPEQLERNPSVELDASNANWIHHNRVDTRGNECVDIKEGARFNVIEHNSCTGQRDEKAAGISSRGNDNIIRFNTVFGNIGAGIRLGGDTERDGIGNHVYGNTLSNNAYAAFKIMVAPQGRLCGNHVNDVSARLVRGRARAGFEPTAPCQ